MATTTKTKKKKPPAKNTSLTKLEADRVKKAVASMNPALKKLYNECAAIVTGMESDMIMGRHRLGQKIDQVLVDPKYGENAADRLAQALGIQPAELYRCRRVAQTWDEDEIIKLTERRTKVNQKAISWGHLFHIASVKDNAKFRRQLITLFFKEGLSVRDLQAHIAAKLGARGNNSKGRPTPRSPLAGLATLHRLSSTLLESQAKLESSIFDSLSNKPDDYASEELLAELETALVEQRKLAEQAEQNSRMLSTAMQTTKQAIEAAKQAETKRPTPARSKSATKKTGRTTRKKRKPATATTATSAAKANGAPKKKKKRRVKRSPAEAIKQARNGAAAEKPKRRKTAPATPA